MRSRRGSSSMIGTLVALVLVVGLVLVFVFGGFGGKAENLRKDQVGETIVGQTKARAKDMVCENNLSQIRQSIAVQDSMDEDMKPASLNELKLPKDMLKCPIGGEDYLYDSQSGKVTCPHPGHEKY